MMLVKEENMTFKDKDILVVGLARSGVGAANLLSELGARVVVTDKQSRSSLNDYINQLSSSIKIITDGNPEEVFDSADIIVISPGVPHNIPQLIHAKTKDVPVIGELELAYQIILSHSRGMSQRAPTPSFIGVTGTNGKSTTTVLIDLMLKEYGMQTILGGNIGNALTKEISSYVAGNNQQSMNIDYIVAEISSFQLETIKEFRPGVAVILNVTPDHLDRYERMQDYINAKTRIFENQNNEDFLVLNADDTVIQKILNSKFKIQNSNLPEVVFFSREKEVHGVYCREGVIYCNLPGVSTITAHTPIISVNEIKIAGVHNLENAMAASLAALLSGCSIEAVSNVLKGFAGLEHRLEFVGENNGVQFINDSKGTNTGAVAKSLESFNDLILIMGGTDKNSDFTVLKDLIESKVKLLILLGEAKDKIAGSIGAVVETQKVNDLEDAVELAVSRGISGDVVLLSPGCASFDMFADFEDRGRKFKEAVSERIK